MNLNPGQVSGRGGVIVSNPGHLPGLVMAAEGLARAGMLAALIDPFAYASLPAALHWLPAPLRIRLVDDFSRRFVSELVAARAVRRGALLEALAVLTLRAGLSRHAWFPRGEFLRLRADIVDRRVAWGLRPDAYALLACWGFALHSMRRARTLNIASYLYFPLPHYRFAERLLAEEAELQPAFAETLQYHRFSPQVVSRLDDEIEEADRILVPSTFARDTFIKTGIAGTKVLSVPLGVDTDLFCPAEQTPPHSTFRVLFVGQITQRKGISYLLDAFRRAAIPRSELVLVGRVCGTDRPWRDLPGVRHVGQVPRRELPALYRSADVFVMPSLLEGFCQTALEAMACGLPVILSENTGTGEITDGLDSFRVPIRDPDSIAERLVDLHQHVDTREAIAERARDCAQRFSWQRFGERVAKAVCDGGRYSS